ncbi:MAG: T9SS type A sorting domain-containing protein [Taibaiella sp.]|nr:T9SS type A sorting domain-containing protein [Taibaiella sp.]
MNIKRLGYLLMFFLLCAFSLQAQTYKWVQKAGENNNVNNAGTTVAYDHHNNIIAAGVYSANSMFGTVVLPGSLAGSAFVAKYDSAGNLLWVKTIQGQGSDEAKGVVIDANDNIYVTGNMNSQAIHFSSADSLTNDSRNGSNGFLARYAPDGTYQWSQSIRSVGMVKALALTLDPGGNPIIGGYFQQYADFSGTILRGGNTNTFLAKYTNSGTLLWANAGKSTDNCLTTALATDAAGNIFATGKISGNTAYGTKQLGTIIDQQFNNPSLPANFYSYIPNVTLNFTGTAMQATGGNNSFYNFIYYNYFTDMENFKVESNVKVITGGKGVGLARFCNVYFVANFPLSITDSNRIILFNYSGAIDSSIGYAVSIGDSINVAIQRSYDTFSATIINYTKHYRISKGYRYTVGPPTTNFIMPNNGYYGMYFLGGTENVYNFKLSSTENYDPLTVFVGNSITTGYYSGGKGHRYQDVLYNTSPYLYATNAGAGDQSINVLYDTTEIVSLHPKYVCMKIGTNDANAGVDTNQYQTNLVNLVTCFRNHGIIPVLATLLPLGGTRVDPYIRRIRAVAATYSLTVVDFYSALVDTATTYMKAIYNYDNVHPNPAGNIKMAQTIAAQAPFLLTDTTAWYGAHQVMQTPSGNDRVFVSKYDPAGNLLWFRLDNAGTAVGTSTLTNYSCGNGIATDNAGNAYVAGNYLDAIYSTGTGVVALQDAFIEKYSGTGTRLWQKRFGNSTNDATTGIASDVSGDPYIIGNYGGNLTIGGTALPAADYTDIFIAKFDTSGNAIWVTNASGHADFGNAIAVDNTDTTIAIAGSFNNTAKFGKITVTSLLTPGYYNYDAFVGRLTNQPPLTVANLQGVQNSFTIYPNPVDELLAISFNTAGLRNILVHNTLGQVVIAQQTYERLMQINTANIPSGIYYISVKEENSSVVTKMLVKK